MLSTSITAAVWIALLAPFAWAAMLVTMYLGTRTERTARCPQRAARELAGRLLAVSPNASLPTQSGRQSAFDNVGSPISTPVD